MQDKDSVITVVFTGVTDTEQLEEAISKSINYPIVFKKEQNNGIVAYVLQGILPDVAQKLFSDFLSESNFPGLDVVVHEGDVFKF